MKTGIGIGPQYPSRISTTTDVAARFMSTIGIPNDSTVYYPSTIYEITGAQQWAALQAFVATTKSAGVYSLLSFLFPRMGGTASSCKYNLVNPSQFGTYSGGWTFSGGGQTPNGTNAYFDTGFTLSQFAQNDLSFITDIKTNAADGSVDLSMFGGGTGDLLIQGRTAGGNLSSRLSNGDGNKTNAVASSQHIYTLSRQSSSQYKAYTESTVLATISATSESLGVYNIVESALNTQGVINLYSTRQHTLLVGGLGMSDAQVSAFIGAWQTFETALHRL